MTTGGALVLGLDGPVASAGSVDDPLPLASISKVFTATAVLVAHEEGTLALGEPAGPAGSTVAHLLAHASGLGPDGSELTSPGTRRIYSNAGYELVAEFLAERSGIPDYPAAALGPTLGLTATSFAGSTASGFSASVRDVAALAHEWLAPGRLLAAETVAEATRPFLPTLSGVLPGFGAHDPNDWGLGPEIRGHKSPHWTGSHNSPQTFGHFGRSGTFVWVDPVAECGLVWLGDVPFGDWTTEVWPALSDAVLDRFDP